MNKTNDEENDCRPAPIRGSLRSLGALFLALGALAGTSAVYAVHGGMQKNPLVLPFEKSVNAYLWAPEGWKFFTRDPQEERMATYVRRDGEWRNASRMPNGSVANALGLNRAGRAQNVELGLLAEKLPKSIWQTCEGGDARSCIERAPIAKEVRNRSPEPSLCGSLALVAQKPVPWAWASLGLSTVMPMTVVRLEVQC
jgi:antimicrobial peptide system SdpA family protein